MNDNQENHLNRAEKVSQFLTDHAADVTATPDLAATLHPQLDANIAKINTDAVLSEADLTGYGTTKDELRTTLNTSVMLVAAGLMSYADDNDDFVLLHMVDFPRSQIEGFRDNRILSFAQLVFEKANVPAVKADLAANHNVSNADIAALSTNRTAFADYIAQPLEKRDERSAYTKLLARDFEELQTTLDKIERKMNTYFVTNRTVWDIYDAANHIDDTGSQGNGTVSLVSNIAAGVEIKIFDITYNAASELNLSNTGGVNLEFSIRLNGAAPPVANPVTVISGNQVDTTMGALAGSGNELWVKNTSGVTGSFGVVINNA